MSDLPNQPHQKDLETRTEESPLLTWLNPIPGGFLTVSRTEVTMRHGAVHLKAERHHIEDGRVVTERVDGEVGPEVFSDMMAIAERQFRDMLTLMEQPMRLFMPWFVPFTRLYRSDDQGADGQ